MAQRSKGKRNANNPFNCVEEPGLVAQLLHADLVQEFILEDAPEHGQELDRGLVLELPDELADGVRFQRLSSSHDRMYVTLRLLSNL